MTVGHHWYLMVVSLPDHTLYHANLFLNPNVVVERVDRIKALVSVAVDVNDDK